MDDRECFVFSFIFILCVCVIVLHFSVDLNYPFPPCRVVDYVLHRSIRLFVLQHISCVEAGAVCHQPH